MPEPDLLEGGGSGLTEYCGVGIDRPPLFYSRATKTDPADIRRIIEGHNANAMRWYAAGDADSLANLFASDAWQMPPNALPLVGREVIRSFWKNALNWGSWKFESRAVWDAPVSEKKLDVTR